MQPLTLACPRIIASHLFRTSFQKQADAMPPKRAPVPRRPESQSLFSTAYTTVTSPENRTVVTALGMFAVSFCATLDL